ncbi:MAG: HAD family hydrolase [Deltaproteobacteria bacterium]|nr:HAD family hydrolase [Deltaproteobacteria bacterium]
MNKAVFLDRDGTINKEVSYLNSIDQIAIPQNSIKALQLLQKDGFKLIVTTNQSGIARGFLTEQTLHNIHKYFDILFSSHNIKIDDYFYCPHLPEENCLCRKPKTKMIEEALKKYNIDKSRSFFIGDKMVDVECGYNAGIKTILVLTGYGQSFKKEAQKKVSFIAEDLYAAASWIMSKPSQSL